jgi:hypothetical protein
MIIALLFCILYRTQELKELGELSPHWDNLRKNVLTHCDQMLNLYQDILAELSKETGMNAMLTQTQLRFMCGVCSQCLPLIRTKDQK